MSVLVIGGDTLGGIEKNLYALGVKELVHISGRKAMNKRKINVPPQTAFILVLTDFINHLTAQAVKNTAKTNAVPIVFAKRSWRSVEDKLRASEVSAMLLS